MTQFLTFVSLPFFRYLFEVRIRFLALFFSLFCTVCISYFYWFELLSLGLFPILKTNGPSSFLFTEPQAAFVAILKISILVTVSLLFPFFLYQLWAFLIPSYFRWERHQLTFLLFVSFGFYCLFFILLFFLFFPALFSFFLQYQFESQVITLRLEPRIDAYIDLLILLSFSFFCFSQFPLVFFLAFSHGFLVPHQLAHHRGFLQPFFFLLAALCAPPDVFIQLGVTILFSLLFELCLWFGFVSFRIVEYRRFDDSRDLSHL